MFLSPTAREIIEQATRLHAEDRRAIIEALADSLWTTPNPGETEPPGHDYRGWLALSGKFHSDYPDVARNKGKHLAEVYYGRRAPDERSPS